MWHLKTSKDIRLAIYKGKPRVLCGRKPTHGNLRELSREHPIRVILHAALKAKKGHGPSMPYKAERRAKAALEMAYNDACGANDAMFIDEVAEQAVQLVQTIRRPVHFTFHGVRVDVFPGDEPPSIAYRYHQSKKEIHHLKTTQPC